MQHRYHDEHKYVQFGFGTSAWSTRKHTRSTCHYDIVIIVTLLLIIVLEYNEWKYAATRPSKLTFSTFQTSLLLVFSRLRCHHCHPFFLIIILVITLANNLVIWEDTRQNTLPRLLEQQANVTKETFFYLCYWHHFEVLLAVQDSSISDIVCLSVCRSVGLSQLTIRA